MLDVLEQALAWGSRAPGRPARGQGSIFDLGDGERGEAAATTRRSRPSEYEKNELLRLEKETLGLYVSEHPLDGDRATSCAARRDCALAELERRRDGEIVTVGGIVGALKQLTTKKGEPMVFMRLDDVTGSAEVVVFNSVYAAARELLRGRPRARRQGPRRPQGGRDEADRDRGRPRSRRRPSARRCGSRSTRARRRPALIRELAARRQGLPRRGAGGRSTLVTSEGPKTLAVRPGLPGRSRCRTSSPR